MWLHWWFGKKSPFDCCVTFRNISYFLNVFRTYKAKEYHFHGSRDWNEWWKVAKKIQSQLDCEFAVVQYKYAVHNQTLQYQMFQALSVFDVMSGLQYRANLSMRISWNIFILQTPERVNCDSLRSSNRYSFRAPQGQSFTTNNQFYVIYTEGDVSISVGVTATNNQNFVSLEESRQYQTATLRK